MSPLGPYGPATDLTTDLTADLAAGPTVGPTVGPGLLDANGATLSAENAHLDLPAPGSLDRGPWMVASLSCSWCTLGGTYGGRMH